MSENGYGYVQFEKKESAELCLQGFQDLHPDLMLEKYVAKANRIDIRRNLYMKNIKYGPEEEVRREMQGMLSAYGTITSILVKETKIQEEKKLFAFVCFESYESAKSVMEAWNDKDIFNNGEKVYVSWAESKENRLQKLRDLHLKLGNDTILYTKNLKMSTLCEELKNTFEKYGKVVRCVIKEPPKIEGKQFKPTKYGYIYYENKEDAKKAQFGIVKDEEALRLYEDQVYINFLLKKESFEKYKQKQ